MQRGRPTHTSLPPNAQLHGNAEHVLQHNHGHYRPPNVSALAAHALTSSLANPYGPNPYSYTNANYHAYFTQTQHPETTAQGYTFSSTYVANAASYQAQRQSPPWNQAQYGRPSIHRVANHVPQNAGENPFSGPGNTRCTHAGCLFAGTKKTVEIHMMDRHLIFPPGWKKRKADWDADPSLKGKPVPIPGTGVMLNTPEAIDAWIAERRKKWPTNQRIEDKKLKVQEAASRGEIDPKDLTARDRKRRRVDSESLETERRGRGRGRGRGIRRGDWRDGNTDSGWGGRGRGRGRGGGATAHMRLGTTGANATPSDVVGEGDDPASSSSDEEYSGSASDMDPIKDAVSSKGPNPESCSRILKENFSDAGQQNIDNNNADTDEHVDSSRNLLNHEVRLPRRQQITQPRAPPPNPFATRPSLLRSLLLPEIRHTVSNISQAIHFLVENDFLDGVELNPGESDSQPIKILKSSDVDHSDSGKTMLNAIQE